MFVTEYLMKEEELIRETAKAEEEIESMQKSHGKYMPEVNSLPRRSGRKKQAYSSNNYESYNRRLKMEKRRGQKRKRNFWKKQYKWPQTYESLERK